MLLEQLRVAALEAVGFLQTTGIPISWLQRSFTIPSHPDLPALVLAFLLPLSKSFLPHSWYPLLLSSFPDSSSLTQLVPTWDTRGRDPRGSVNPVLRPSQCFLTPDSSPSLPPEPHSSSLTESLLMEAVSGDCLVRSLSLYLFFSPPVTCNFHTGFLGIPVLTLL